MPDLYGNTQALLDTLGLEVPRARELAALTEHPPDGPTLRAQVRVDLGPEGTWRTKWFVEPAGRPDRLVAAIDALIRRRSELQASLATHDATVTALRTRHDATPLGDPVRAELEAKATHAVAGRDLVARTVDAIDRALAVEDLTGSTGLLGRAREGLGRYLEAIWPIWTEAALRDVAEPWKAVIGMAAQLHEILAAQEQTLKHLTRVAGRPLRLPVLRCDDATRAALGEMIRARDFTVVTTEDL